MRALAVLLVLAASAHADAPRRVTLHEAIDLALGKNPDLAIARESVAGADAHVAGIKARRFPSLHVDGNGNIYYKPFNIAFGGQSFKVYDQQTAFSSVTLSQPLTGLAYLSELIGAAEHEANAARDEYDRARLEVAYRTAEAYLRVLSARVSADVAHRSVVDIQSGLDRALQLRAADTYTDIDVLRFRSAKAAADQSALRSDTARDVALAQLVVQLGLHDGTPLDVVDDLPPAAPPLAMTLEQAQARALTARPELHAAREKIAVAQAQRRAAWAPYFPDIRAVGVWEHTEGQTFLPANTELVGLRLSWNVWDWGATHKGVVEAEAAQARARLGAEAQIDQIKLEVRRRWLDAKTAFDSLAAAETQQKTAEEAHRLQQVRFDAGAATTTDVLDAEIDVARARLGFADARYDYFLATLALARAVGDLPNPAL
jgi:outer membrane protein